MSWMLFITVVKALIDVSVNMYWFLFKRIIIKLQLENNQEHVYYRNYN